MSSEIENRTYSLKRSFYTYLAYPVFIVLFGKNVINIDFNRFEVIDAVNIIGLVVFVLILGRIIFQPAFIKVGFDQITIYRDFFYPFWSKLAVMFIKKQKTGSSVRLDLFVFL